MAGMTPGNHWLQNLGKLLAWTALVTATSLATTSCGDSTEREPEALEPTGKVLSALSYDCTAYTDTGYDHGKPFAITLVHVAGYPVEIHTADALLTLMAAAEKDGVTIKINDGFRSMAEQQYYYDCFKNCSCNACSPAAAPGYSNHQSGHAIDFEMGGGGYNWIFANAAKFGFNHDVGAASNEDWHWEWWGGGNPTAYCSDKPPKGSLDQASCESISGWAQDPDVATAALDVHLYFGPAGSPEEVKVALLADQHRDDLCSAIGSCSHAFSLPTPRSLLDGQPHPVRAYGIGQKGGANAQLGKSPLSLLCPPQPLAPSAILRRVKSEASFDLWKFSKFQDVAPLYDSGAKVDPTAGKEGPELPLSPEVVRPDDGTSDLWLLDSGVRRRIPGESARAAWRLGEPTSMATSMLYLIPLGADLPPIPALVMGPGPAFFVIDEPFLPDASEPTPDPKTPPSQGTTTPDSKAPPVATALPTKGDGSSAETTPTMPPAQDSSEGCSLGGTAGRGQEGGLLSAVFGVSMLLRLAARRRARLASS